MPKSRIPKIPVIPKIAVALSVTIIAALLLFARADDSRLEATVSADKPHKLQVHIGGDAIRDQIYPDFKASSHMAEINGRYRIPRTGETGYAKLSFGSQKLTLGSYEIGETFNLEPGDQWDLETGDKIAVEVKVGDVGHRKRPGSSKSRDRYMANVLKTDYIYITVS